jgi:hypothetical protein
LGVRFDNDEMAVYMEDSTNNPESQFKSCWNVYDKYYRKVIIGRNLVPPALINRIDRVGSTWKELMEFKIEESKHYQSGKSNSYRRTVGATDPETFPLDDIDLGASSRLDDGDALMYNSEVLSFKAAPGSADYTHGAFETELIHCPVTFVEQEDGTTKCLPLVGDDSTKFGATKSDWPVSWQAELPEGKWIEYFTRTPLDAKSIIRKAAERYPFGTILTVKGKRVLEVYVNFNVILRMGSFSASGSATGIALRIAELLTASAFLPKDRKNGYETDLYKCLAGLSGMMLKWLSPSNMKKAIRGSKDGVGCKVMTSTAPKVQDARIYYWTANTLEDGTKAPFCNVIEVEGKFVPDTASAKVFTMPVICINPNDDALGMANIDQGSIVDVGRTPMVATFMAIVLIDSTVSLGHAEVAARYQGLVNHGDGDGDPVDFVKVASAINPAEANAIFANGKFFKR